MNIYVRAAVTLVLLPLVAIVAFWLWAWWRFGIDKLAEHDDER